MEYQFDYATFCKTFNVKDDKAIDSLRLTHTQDINFKLFPYKASGKTQAPIITELEEVVSDFFRKSLKLESEPVQYESLCDNIITEMDIEDEDIEIFKEMIHSLFFEGDNFVAKNLGLYPYQTKVNNKSVDRLAGFLIDVLGLNGNDCNIIEQAMKNYPYNVVEKLVVDAIQTSKIGSTNNNKSYFPVVIGVQEKFKNDFYFMLNTGMTSLDDLSNLLAVYYFYYMSQACVTLDNFGSGKRNSPVQLYYALDWEKVSKNRKCCVEGWERIQSSANHMFSHAVTLEILNQHKFSGVMLDYISLQEYIEKHPDRDEVNTIFECFDREIICNEEKIENQEQFLRSIEFDDIKEIFDKCCFLSQDEHLQFLKAAKKSKAEGLNFLLDIPTEWEKEQKRVKDNIDILSNGKKKSTSYIPRLKNRKAEEEQKLTEFDKIVQENQENTQVPYHKLFINKDVIWDREQFPMDEIAYNNSMNEIDLLMYFSEHKQECANYYWNLPYQNLVKEYNGDKFISFAEYPLEYTYRFINLLKEEENIETEYQKEKRYRGILDCIQKNQFANLNWDFLRQEELLEIEVINFIKIQLEEIRSLKQMQGIVQEAILTLKESRKILVSKADIIMEKELISSKNCPLCGAAYADRDQLDTKIKEETNVLNRISDNTTTQIQTIQKSIYEDYLEKVEEKIQMKLENSISDETYTKLQKIKRNKAKVFEVEQLLQKIEIEIDDKGRTEEFLLEGYNMLIARIKEKLKPVSEELSMRLKEKKFEDYYERFYDKNPELFFYVNKEELCEKRIYINGIRHNFYITERDKRSKEIEKLEIRIKKLEKVHEELKRYSDALEEGIIEYKKKIISDIEPLLHVYTAKILQQKFNGKSIYISTNEAVDNIQFVNSMKDKQDILYSMSSGQLSAVAISFLLCMNQVYGKNNPCSILLIDDPVQTIDDVNMVGLVDLLRYEFEDRQIFISTHEQTFEWFLRYRYSKANKAVKIFNMKEIMLNEEA